ncbi:MAG: hypothetical protein R2791_22295 [Saprospiraceae bacterium]
MHPNAAQTAEFSEFCAAFEKANKCAARQFANILRTIKIELPENKHIITSVYLHIFIKTGYQT